MWFFSSFAHGWPTRNYNYLGVQFKRDGSMGESSYTLYRIDVVSRSGCVFTVLRILVEQVDLPDNQEGRQYK